MIGKNDTSTIGKIFTVYIFLSFSLIMLYPLVVCLKISGVIDCPAWVVNIPAVVGVTMAAAGVLAFLVGSVLARKIGYL